MPPPHRNGLSVVIPVRDEAPNVEAVTEELLARLSSEVDLELIFVDDGSTDGTPELLARLVAREPRVRLVADLRRRGKSAALVDGVRAARWSWVATMDGDGQSDPGDLLRLYELALREAGGASPLLIAGQRIERPDGRARHLASMVANRVRGALLRDGVTDSACPLKVFRREHFLALPRFEGMHRFLPALIWHVRGTVLTVPVAARPRAGGRSKYGIADRLFRGARDLARVLWLRSRVGRYP